MSIFCLYATAIKPGVTNVDVRCRCEAQQEYFCRVVACPTEVTRGLAGMVQLWLELEMFASADETPRKNTAQPLSFVANGVLDLATNQPSRL